MAHQRKWFLVIAVLLLFRIWLFIYFVSIDGQYLTPDSSLYLLLADNLLNHQVFSRSLLPPFEPNFFRTPGYPLFLASIKYMSGANPYWLVFWQELLFYFSLWIFYRLGKPLFGKKIARISILFLLLEPGSIFYCKSILSEVLLLPFLYTGLLFIGHYLKNLDWRYLILSGIFIGLGVLVRPALLYLPIIICWTLIAFNFRRKQLWLHGGILLITVSLVISPWIVRNQQYSDEIFISGQGSNLFANFHVTAVWKSAKGIPIQEGVKIIADKVNAFVQQKEKFRGYELSVIETYKIQQEIAFKELSKYPIEYSKLWLIGFLKAMPGIQITRLYETFKIDSDRLHFNEIKNLNLLNTLWVYLKTQNILILSFIFLRIVIAIFSVIGAMTIIFKHRNCFLWIMMLTNFYFISIAGPVTSVRFHYPIGVFWFIQACYGFFWVVSLCRKDSGSKTIIQQDYHLPHV